jgi:hypothetical protein
MGILMRQIINLLLLVIITGTISCSTAFQDYSIPEVVENINTNSRWQDILAGKKPIPEFKPNHGNNFTQKKFNGHGPSKLSIHQETQEQIDAGNYSNLADEKSVSEFKPNPRNNFTQKKFNGHGPSKLSTHQETQEQIDAGNYSNLAEGYIQECNILATLLRKFISNENYIFRLLAQFWTFSEQFWIGREHAITHTYTLPERLLPFSSGESHIRYMFFQICSHVIDWSYEAYYATIGSRYVRKM